MSIRDIPTFPYRLVEPDDMGVVSIEDAPLVPAERSFFLLMTSEEFQNSPQNFGSVAPDGRTLLPCLHAMVSIAISHADNVYTRTPAYADRDASNIIFRTFEHPTKRGNFAILMQASRRHRRLVPARVAGEHRRRSESDGEAPRLEPALLCAGSEGRRRRGRHCRRGVRRRRRC
jgi:hypothetical protein